jgi:hypothetical protein
MGDGSEPVGVALIGSGRMGSVWAMRLARRCITG